MRPLSPAQTSFAASLSTPKNIKLLYSRDSNSGRPRDGLSHHLEKHQEKICYPLPLTLTVSHVELQLLPLCHGLICVHLLLLYLLSPMLNSSFSLSVMDWYVSVEDRQVEAMEGRWIPRWHASDTLWLLLAVSREPESAGAVAGTSGGRGPSHGLALWLPEMVRSLHIGGHMWKLPHAGSVSDVREHVTRGKAVGDPKEGAVSVLSSTPRYGTVPVTVPASLSCQGMHENAP